MISLIYGKICKENLILYKVKLNFDINTYNTNRYGNMISLIFGKICKENLILYKIKLNFGKIFQNAPTIPTLSLLIESAI